MTERDWALLLHLAGFALLFAGMAVAAIAQAGARRRERADEIAAVLGLTRAGVALVTAGALVIVGSGLWLIETSNGLYSLGDGWIAGSLGLLLLAFVLGALGARAEAGAPARRAARARRRRTAGGAPRVA